MNKTILAAFALASVLSACSSQPSDHRPSEKVSVDQVPPGTRETDIYNLNGGEDTEHDTHGHAEGDAHRSDVMPNHDEHKSDIGGNDQVPAEEKTTDAEHVENHE